MIELVLIAMLVSSKPVIGLQNIYALNNINTKNSMIEESRLEGSITNNIGMSSKELKNNIENDMVYLEGLEERGNNINILIHEIEELNDELKELKNMSIKTPVGINVYMPNVTEEINNIRHKIESRVQLITGSISNTKGFYSLPNRFMLDLDNSFLWLINDLRGFERWKEETSGYLKVNINTSFEKVDIYKRMVERSSIGILKALNNMGFGNNSFDNVDMYLLYWPLTIDGLVDINGYAVNNKIALSPSIWEDRSNEDGIWTLYHEMGHIFWNKYTGDFEGNSEFGDKYNEVRISEEMEPLEGVARAEMLADDFAYIYINRDINREGSMGIYSESKDVYKHRFGGIDKLGDSRIINMLDDLMDSSDGYYINHNLGDIYNVVDKDFKVEVDTNLDKFKIMVGDMVNENLIYLRELVPGDNVDIDFNKGSGIYIIRIEASEFLEELMIINKDKLVQ